MSNAGCDCVRGALHEGMRNPKIKADVEARTAGLEFGETNTAGACVVRALARADEAAHANEANAAAKATTSAAEFLDGCLHFAYPTPGLCPEGEIEPGPLGAIGHTANICAKLERPQDPICTMVLRPLLAHCNAPMTP